MAFNSDLLRVIDDRIRQYFRADTAMGTIAAHSLNYTDREAMVTFDGSSVAVPVRLFGGIEALPGDRVALQKFGTVWNVVNTYIRRMPSSGGGLTTATVGSTTSTTHTPTPGGESFTFIKRWNDTRVWLSVAAGCYADTAATMVAFGLSFNGAASVEVCVFYFNDTSTHRIVSGFVPGHSGLAAGEYTVTLTWKQVSGSGSLRQDTNDWNAYGAVEQIP